MYILFIGDTNVGKTTIIDKIKEICQGKSQTIMDKSITLGIKTYQVNYKGSILRLIDSGEYYSHQTILQGFLPYVSFVVVVYDIYSKESFRYAVRLFWEFSTKYNNIYKTYLLGNKIDSPGNRNRNLQWENDHTIKVSGKTGENVEEILKIFKIAEKNDEKEEGAKNNEWCCFF